MPEIGDKVRIWPRPGRRLHLNERPVDAMGGGRFALGGEEVVWSKWHEEQMRTGDLLLQSPEAK